MEISVQAIGQFKCANTKKLEAPRQAKFSEGGGGVIELESSFAGDSLSDLNSFSHIWVIYQFHKNSAWKPKVLPPRGDAKRGVFATRSPHRPNFIGMSCVSLRGITGRKIYVGPSDILDGSPVIDIKPYIPEADAVHEANSGWLENLEDYTVSYSDQSCESKVLWVDVQTSYSFKNIVEQQLLTGPFKTYKKRIEVVDEHQSCLSVKTWRVYFSVQGQSIQIQNVRSGYDPKELSDQDDPYGDKEIHREFLSQFG